MTEPTINLDCIARSIAIVSDLHAGSDFAVWPHDDVINSTGNNITDSRNDSQVYLADCWENYIEECDAYNVDTVINLADSCQGVNYKDGGRACITPDLELQKDAAEALLLPIVYGRNYIGFSGSKYHQSMDTKVHRDLARRVKPIAKSSSFYGAIANLRLKGTDKVANIAHASTSAMLYPSTALDRERIFLKVAEARDVLPKIDIMIRGHLHKYMTLRYSDMTIIQSPCWQAWYPLGTKMKLYGKHQPDIGALILLIDNNGGIHVEEFMYKAPHVIDKLREG